MQTSSNSRSKERKEKSKDIGERGRKRKEEKGRETFNLMMMKGERLFDY
jgi:hypothetical protein